MRTKYVEAGPDTKIYVEEDAQFVLGFQEFKDTQKYFLDLIFEKEGVSAEILGVYRLGEGNVLDLTTVATHRVPNTSCITKIKGVLYDGSKSSYTGKIVIEKNAQQTSSFLEDNVLVLGNDVESNSSPLLEIEANDVKASHGATTGRISEEQLFYLCSRGLSRVEAEELIVKGFFSSLIDGIIDEEIRTKVKKEIDHE
jgi:Fe-S cluster assembly protein SufD